jgi:hypothetical protein
MFVFGCAITEPEHYRRYGEPGIRRAAEADSVVFAEAAPRSLARVHNLILDQAAALSELEGVVLVRERAELLDPSFCERARELLADPEVAIVGCAGASGVRSIAWWESERARTSSVYRSEELGGDYPGLIADGWEAPASNGRIAAAGFGGPVDCVDGVLMVLSPWAVRTLRFDESLGPHYGYDYDLCLQARAGGRTVLLAELALAHAYPLGVVDDPEVWIEAYTKAAEKWETGDGSAVDWRARARRAEGTAAAARLLSASKMYEIQALEWTHERELAAATASFSWKLTAPLRKASLLAQEARQAREGRRQREG